MPTIAARPAVRVRRPSAPAARRPAPDLRRRTGDIPVGEESLAYRMKGWGERLSASSVLDHIIYRRLWIPILAAALLGIVAMQVATLGINAGIGRTVDRSVLLERENTVLAAEVSRLESADRLNTAVAGMGMVDPAPGSTRYLRADGSVVADATAPERVTSVAAAPPAEPVQQTPSAAAQTPPTQPQQTAPAATAPAAAAPPATTAPAAQPPAQQPPPASPATSGGAVSGGTTAPIAPTAAVGVR